MTLPHRTARRAAPDLWNGDAITIDLPYPPSVNHYWRRVGARTLISSEGRRYLDTVAQIVMLSRQRFGIACHVAVKLEAYMPDNRRRDIDNLVKVCLDSITKAGVMLDDSQVRELSIRHCGVKLGGAMVVTITKL